MTTKIKPFFLPDLAAVDLQLQNRERILKELFDNEGRYIAKLQAAVEYYKKPMMATFRQSSNTTSTSSSSLPRNFLSSNKAAGVIRGNDVEIVFGNLEDLLKISRRFYNGLKDRYARVSLMQHHGSLSFSQRQVSNLGPDAALVRYHWAFGTCFFFICLMMGLHDYLHKAIGARCTILYFVLRELRCCNECPGTNGSYTRHKEIRGGM